MNNKGITLSEAVIFFPAWDLKTEYIMLTIIISLTGAIALIVFLIIKNNKDRKKYLPPQSTDKVEEDKTEKQRRRNKL